MTALTEAGHAGSCIISLANGNQSKENVTLVTGQNLAANTVLGKITASGKYKVYDQEAGDGSEVAAGILLWPADASDADLVVAIVARDAEVIADELVWPDGSPVDVTAGIADLKAIGILVRS